MHLTDKHRNTAKREITTIQNVGGVLLHRVISKNTSASTQERNHVTASNVEKLLLDWVILKHTGASTQERSHSAARSVDRVLLIRVISKTTSASTQERSRITAQSVEKSFTVQRNLQDNQRIHTGEKPPHCSVCGKSSTDKSALTTHYRIPT